MEFRTLQSKYLPTTHGWLRVLWALWITDAVIDLPTWLVVQIAVIVGMFGVVCIIRTLHEKRLNLIQLLNREIIEEADTVMKNAVEKVEKQIAEAQKKAPTN